MNTRLVVQSAIKQLPKDEIRNLAKWLQEYLDEECDQQIDLDVGLEVNPAVIEQLLAIRQSKSPTLTTEEVKQRLGSIDEEHPILKFAGIFKDDADFAAVVANIAADRADTTEE
ncbi:hypothetical protein [Chamaesiphon sp. OTE_75_metabat_556]|uniref:hypothetical protein n=1 Tax=Chamaesiphon sp. OTE_75_metabat_556 TaxID=2964692 RepID=UPI00286A1BEC|nr:hypothetical protein [Chamaesiphon sp. OTE_75_metabat_556]